jgi:hypothetical protein
VKVRMDVAPQLIEHFWAMAKTADADCALWLEKAAVEANPEIRKGLERLAETELAAARALQSDADLLLEKFLAAGGSYEAKH